MFSEKALRLILEAEGLDQPGNWPGASSGITIGRGYDLRYSMNFEDDWESYLSPDEIARLKTVLGKLGSNELAKQFKDIRISREAADHVFYDKTLPEYIRQTREAFPGFDDLPLDAQGALVSLVYNRGASMHDNSEEDRRREMRVIRDDVQKGDLQDIADQLRSMKRLWVGKGVDGLLRRRDDEAELVESCIAKEELTGWQCPSKISSTGANSEGETGSSGSSSLLQTIIDAILNIFKK
jgi:GH24 family phage-related lysozyme (muramidase)